MDPFTLIAGLGGGLMNMLGTMSTNRTNMMMNTGSWKGTQILDEARMLGVSPLALLGQSFNSTPMQNPFADANQMGQNLARASATQTSGEQKIEALKVQQLELQNASLHNDVIAGQLRNSRNAVDIRQAGAPPSVPSYPMYARFWDSENKRWVLGRSREYAESSFSGDPIAMGSNIVESLNRGIMNNPFFASTFGGPFDPRIGGRKISDFLSTAAGPLFDMGFNYGR